MRCDQFRGLSIDAIVFLSENELKTDVCHCCQRPFDNKLEQIGHYDGMFMDEYPLFRHKLTDGRTADEFHQASPWSSGPVHFLGLRVSDGTEFIWSEDEIDNV
jgi:hypothetical protein